MSKSKSTKSKTTSKEAVQVKSEQPTAPTATIASPLNLLSVDPFQYVAKLAATPSADHSTQAIISGLASVQLESQMNLQNLLKTTTDASFEAEFFRHIHATGSKEAFLSEPLDSRRASSRLLSPVLCAELMSQCAKSKRLIPASVLEALLCSGHVSVYRSDLVDRVLAARENRNRLLRALLVSMNDFSDSELIRLIQFVLEAPESEFKYASEVDVLLWRLLGLPKSPVLLKVYLMAWPTATILAFLDKMYGFFLDAQLTNKRKALLLDWLSVILDSQYPLCLMNSEMMQRITLLHTLLSEEVKFDSELAGWSGVLESFSSGRERASVMRMLPKVESIVNGDNAHYSIHLTDL